MAKRKRSRSAISRKYKWVTNLVIAGFVALLFITTYSKIDALPENTKTILMVVGFLGIVLAVSLRFQNPKNILKNFVGRF